MRDLLPPALLAALLSACSLAPKYQRPAAPVPDSWPVAPAAAAEGSVAAADQGWRDVLGDPRLQAVVALALSNNRDLRVASLNVELARARYGIARSAQFPELDASGNYLRARTPLDQSVVRVPYTSSMWTVGVGVTAWELDLWGRVRSLKEAALQSWFSTVEAQRAAHLSLVAETASLYLATRALDEEVDLTRRTLSLVQSSYDLTRRRYEVGQVSELDLRTAEVQVETARVNLAALSQQRALLGDALVLLVGAPLPDDLPPPAPLDASGIVADLPAGLPSDLLRRRPDLLGAEHSLMAASANIGAARAAFFPTISLTAQGGFSSVEIDHLFDQSSGMWMFSPRITLPIFDGGRNSANLKVTEVSRDLAVAQYEKSIQVAFREVADALQSRGEIETQIDGLSRRSAAAERRYQLAQLRFEKGVDSSLVVLSAQQDLYAAQQLLVQARLARLQNLVGLYRALGGGWLERTAQGEPKG
ncbi:MAG TPA: efflux transporter outer membrane subunit [Anaeromyxobacter sp.]|nr:efflux transporter outer membrane subunit [Anaeromyxobacter sp.]